MDRQHLEELFDKYQSGILSPQEKAELDNWYMQKAKSSTPLQDAELYNSLLSEMDKAFPFETPAPVRKTTLWPRTVAAAAVAAVAFGLWFYANEIASPQNTSRNDVVVHNEIAPGSVGATLTLANGKKIKLAEATNGELAEEAGVSITKTVNGQIIYKVGSAPSSRETEGSLGNTITNTLSTAKGETYQLKLPDGSMVHLNAASSLSYSPSLRENGRRVVELRGEGYFEISKDKKHPFIVKTDKQEVEVLGTHFNINAYKDEPAITTLLEGSVKVRKSDEQTLLKPGEQSIVTNHKLSVSKANISEAIAWKDGYFNFFEEPIESIMRKISRWYDVEIIYEGKITTERFNGGISRFKNVKELLEMLESTGSVHFKIEGRRVTVMP